jgi:hypothetical protein
MQTHARCNCKACVKASYEAAKAPIVLGTPNGPRTFNNYAHRLSKAQYTKLVGLDDVEPRGHPTHKVISQESYAARARVPLLEDSDSEH